MSENVGYSIAKGTRARYFIQPALRTGWCAWRSSDALEFKHASENELSFGQRLRMYACVQQPNSARWSSDSGGSRLFRGVNAPMHLPSGSERVSSLCRGWKRLSRLSSLLGRNHWWKHEWNRRHRLWYGWRTSYRWRGGPYRRRGPSHGWHFEHGWRGSSHGWRGSCHRRRGDYRRPGNYGRRGEHRRR